MRMSWRHTSTTRLCRAPVVTVKLQRGNFESSRRANSSLAIRMIVVITWSHLCRVLYQHSYRYHRALTVDFVGTTMSML